jgi:tetratricopeptide (TPR) repeat protein
VERAATAGVRRRQRPGDPDRLAALEEERDFLLRSLDDLDAERAAGDLDDADHQALRNDYTARAAAAIRAVDEHRASLPPRAPRSRRRFALLAVVAAVLAVVAGLALADAAGQRDPGETITGSVDSTRTRVLECQELGADLTKLLDAIRCFDDVLATDPGNVEALTYRGWYLVLGWNASGRTAAADELRRSGITFLDRAIATDPSFADAYAFRAVAADWSGDPATACARLADLERLPRAPVIDQLVGPLSDRLACGTSPDAAPPSTTP